MVDALVSLAVERISHLLIQEATFLSHVKPDVVRLQAELKRMQCFLKDADRRQDHDARVRNWITEIRGIAYESEDIIDTFILKAAKNRGGARGLIKKFISVFTKLPDLYKIGNQIESIRTKIGDISASMQTYGIQFDPERDSEMQQRLRRSYPHDEEEHVISFDAVTRELKTQLMMEEEQLRVVSIVGMGGLGKTTLAKKVYNGIDIKHHFDCYSWAFISQQFSPRDVLIGIVMEVASAQDNSNLERMDEEMASKLKKQNMKEELVHRSLLEKMKLADLIKTLHDVLKEKRYIVVLDDIWNIEGWNSLKHAFPNGMKGSKILFTTRNRNVASDADPRSTPVEPLLLNEDEGWELLSKKALLKDVIQHDCILEYEKLGMKMVRKCGGLPLAVAVIGGLLATKKSVEEWKAVERNINAHFSKLEDNHQYGGVYGVLAMSYFNLPFHLKPCFLYLSQFPEDWEIQKKTLIRMWIAEGFISQSIEKGDETMEDRAEEYLEELVRRCMIQVSQRDHTGRGVKICRMHDLVRDMCISKAKDENFLGVENRDYIEVAASAAVTIFSTVTRRVAIHSRASERQAQNDQLFCLPLLERGNLQLRSLFYFVEEDTYGMAKKQAIFIFKSFRLLRVLNFGNVNQSYGHLPEEIGNLIHLRFLGFRGSSRMMLYHDRPLALPDSISKLRSLYTLDLRNNYRMRLPDGVWKLECLRHLIVEEDVQGLHRLDSLRNLETLKRVRAETLIRKGAVLQMTNLRNLAVKFETKEEVEVILKSPSFVLGRIRSLEMDNPYGRSFPDLKALSGCEDLTKAILIGKLIHGLEFLPASLSKLILWWSNLEQDPMVILEKLPNLRCLFLGINAYGGLEIVCSANGFRKLEYLVLDTLKVEEWRIEKGAMPCLKTLCLVGLLKLRMIPEGLKFVTTLQELKIIGMEEFVKRVKVIDGVKGEDFDKILHIPSISFRSLRDIWQRPAS